MAFGTGGTPETMTDAQTIDALRSIAAEARLRHKAERRAALLAVQAALRRYAATFEEAPAEFAVRVLLEIDTALPRVGPEPHDGGPTRETSRVLGRAAADLCLLLGD
jgi:hypothetical protein